MKSRKHPDTRNCRSDVGDNLFMRSVDIRQVALSRRFELPECFMASFLVTEDQLAAMSEWIDLRAQLQAHATHGRIQPPSMESLFWPRLD